MMEFVKINGAHGEGGGQIIRTATTLACITKKPIIIKDIRKNRNKQGLKAQHITTIKILQEMCDAKVEGNYQGSTELSFVPREMRACRIKKDVGTAGSISLIVQSIIPAMAASKEPSEIGIVGGTDVPWSPTFDYLTCVTGEAFYRMGMKCIIRLNKRGYYPKGGGEATLSVNSSGIFPIKLIESKTKSIEIRCSYSKIPEKSIGNEIGKVVKKLEEMHYTIQIHSREENAKDAGASLLAYAKDGGSIRGVDALFNKNDGCFDVELGRIISNNLGVDENLADMIVVPASIACGMSVFRVPRITRHLETNLFVASKISGCRYGVGKINGGFEVRIEGTSHASI